MTTSLEDKNKQIALDLFAAMEALDKNAILDLLTEDVFYHNTSLPKFTAAKNKRSVEKQLDQMLHVIHTCEVAEYLDIKVDGNVVTVERYENLGLLGVRMQLHVIGEIEIRGDKICAWRDDFTLSGAAKALMTSLIRPAF